jgi:hypothetical protein
MWHGWGRGAAYWDFGEETMEDADGRININMDLQEVGWRGMAGLLWPRWRTFVNAVMNLRVT